MLTILLMLTGYHLWNENVHEWLGILFFFIVLLHNGLNVHWFKALFQGEYPAFRILLVSVNALLITVFICAIASGLMLSRHILADWPIHNVSDWVRKTHMTSVHWIQVIIAVHLGLHWKMLANFFCRICRISPVSPPVKWILPAFFFIISVYGLYAFIQREMLPYLLMQVDFAFFNYEESGLKFYWDLLAVTIFFAYPTRFLVWLLLFRNRAL